MNEFKATASEHLKRDLEDRGKWVCQCDACVHIRSLMGVEKMLDARPLVRALEQTGAELEGLAPGPDRDRVLRRYLDLHDKLAAVIAE